MTYPSCIYTINLVDFSIAQVCWVISKECQKEPLHKKKVNNQSFFYRAAVELKRQLLGMIDKGKNK